MVKNKVDKMGVSEKEKSLFEKRISLFDFSFPFLFILIMLVLNLFMIFLNLIMNISIVILIILVFDVLYLMMVGIFEKYLFEKGKKNLENGLVDEILRISSLPKTNDLKTILEKLKSSYHQEISQEFKEVYNKIEKGYIPKEVFSGLKEKYNSEILNKFLDLIILSTTTGTVSMSDYKLVAEDFLKSKKLIDERNSLLLMQKYTIIFAGGLIVPGILGVVISLVSKLKTDASTSILNLVNGSSLYSVSYVCSIIYIVEYVIISSIYLALLEDNYRKAVVYLVVLLPASLLIFFLSSYLI